MASKCVLVCRVQRAQLAGYSCSIMLAPIIMIILILWGSHSSDTEGHNDRTYVIVSCKEFALMARCEHLACLLVAKL